jgi:hypothetical protein
MSLVSDICELNNKHKQTTIYLVVNTCIFYSFSSNQRGVAIIINTNFEYKIITKNKKVDGEALL